MHAMILAAGLGLRMKPLTNDLPKALIEVGDTTLIERHLAALQRAGFSRVVINVHHLAEMIMNRIGDGTRYDLEVVFSREEQLLETAGGIRKALPLLGDRPFAVISSDIYCDYDVACLPAEMPERSGHLVMVDNPGWHPEGDFAMDEQGIIGARGQRLTYSGISVYEPSFFEGDHRGPQKLRELFDRAMPRGRLTGEHYHGFWSDVGTPERLAALKSMLE